jgi:Hemerythrin HHE cation binding domain.
MVVDSGVRTSSLDRRRLVGLTTAVAGGGVLTVATGGAARAVHELPLSPPEDLMREHGLLNRVILIYREAIARIERGEAVPNKEIGAAASVIRALIHDHHEHVEERYLFSALLRARRHTATIHVLLAQHAVGRALTTELLQADNTPSNRFGSRARRKLVTTMSDFIRMYQPHETREDTEIFPAFRAITPPRKFADLSEELREQEFRRFGPMGFARFVGKVIDIERSLGINDLAKFTPQGSGRP